MSGVVTTIDNQAIPSFTHDGCLPPFVGTPTGLAGRAPYIVSMRDLVSDLNFSARRLEILTGFSALRRKLFLAGAIRGFQWIDGSFTTEKEEPGDIDLVTFYSVYENDQSVFISNLAGRGVDILDKASVKGMFHCDSYYVYMNDDPERIISWTAYWLGVFCHDREKKWKGILQIPLIQSARQARLEYELICRAGEGL
uniref:Uncharacterized protein n=1 Tax=Nitratidesulfovibrio vulgaris (strain DSM 19637 / Miyazaki F) TaxID=883 RepID=B8DKY6_NITV9